MKEKKTEATAKTGNASHGTTRMTRRIMTVMAAISLLMIFPPAASAQGYGHHDRRPSHYAPTPPRPQPLSDEAFNVLYRKVKKQSFKDNKLDMIEVACLGCFFTCRQGAELLGLMSFTDDKKDALRVLSPYIVDRENSYVLIKAFTFDTDRREAARILGLDDGERHR